MSESFPAEHLVRRLPRRISIVVRLCCVLGAVPAMMAAMKYWEMIADELSAAGWGWGYCSAVTRHGRRFVVDAYRGDGRRYIVESDELLSAFLQLESSLLP